MDTALKQRLVGASVLIALAVVVLPMLLGGRPDGEGQETQIIELPPQPPELDFETRRYPIGESPTARDPNVEPQPTRPLPTPGPTPDTVASPDPGPGPDVNPATDSTAENAGQPAEEELADQQPAEVDPPSVVDVAPLATPDVSTSEQGRYIVQVASFGALNNANRLAATLGDYGYSVMLDSIKTDVGTMHRVRVGPYSTEAQANGDVTRIQSQVENIKPRVMDLQPDKASQVTAPSDPLGRWVVQVGTFSNAGNADKLVARLRLESMSAYKEEVSRSDSVVYRVRVGPFLQRQDAIKADQLVAERLSIDGVVMSSD